MRIGNFDCIWVMIEEPWREGANHEAGSFKRLMNRRRLMDRACDWLEVISIECVWVNQTVPTDDIKWVMGHRVARQPLAMFDDHGHVLFTIDCVNLGRPVEITLVIR